MASSESLSTTLRKLGEDEIEKRRKRKEAAARRLIDKVRTKTGEFLVDELKDHAGDQKYQFYPAPSTNIEKVRDALCVNLIWMHDKDDHYEIVW